MDEDADARRGRRGNWWLFLRDVESWHMQKRCIFAVLQCALQTATVGIFSSQQAVLNTRIHDNNSLLFANIFQL